jgi:hypothetical protein
MVLNQDAIRELIPHRASMPADTAEYWDAERDLSNQPASFAR